MIFAASGAAKERSRAEAADGRGRTDLDRALDRPGYRTPDCARSDGCRLAQAKRSMKLRSDFRAKGAGRMPLIIAEMASPAGVPRHFASCSIVAARDRTRADRAS